MKELEQFTVEQLEKYSNLEALTFPPSHAQVAVLARIALAAKQAKPVYQERRYQLVGKKQIEYWADINNSTYGYLPESERRLIYTTPPLKHSEISDCWVACNERMPADCQAVLCSNLLTELSGIPFIADYVGMFELYDGTKYESGFYVNRELQTVTHWMPLPVTPKPEK